MVICTYRVHITMEDFRVRMADFKPNKWLQLALEVFSSIIRTISSLQLQVLLPKQYGKMRHGYRYIQRTYYHGRFQGQKCCVLSQINGFAMVIRQINGFNWHWKSSLVLFEQFHHFSCKFSFRNSIEKFAMVICTCSVHITMEDSRVRKVDFKPYKWLQLALEVFSSIIRTISSPQLQVLAPKQYRKIRHGYMYVQRTYNHGRFQGQKCSILSQINGFAMVIGEINGFNWHQKSSLVLFE